MTDYPDLIDAIVKAGVPGRVVSGADYHSSDGERAAKALGGARTAMIEAFVHQQLSQVDPTARTTTPNTAYRDHELLDNSAWVDSKAGWCDSPGLLGHPPVPFQEIQEREWSKRTDAIAIVQLRPQDITYFLPSTGVGIVAACHPPRWWLVSVSELQKVSRARSTLAAEVCKCDIAPYEITADAPLTLERLVAVLKPTVHPPTGA